VVRVEPLLCNDREMGGYTRAVSGQRLGKHVLIATDTKATIKELFSMWSASRFYKQGTRLELSLFATTTKICIGGGFRWAHARVRVFNVSLSLSLRT
jgi:hypothetical protein